MNKAFTLAEVLITIGIIGVVAAFTLPALIGTHQEKATVAKLKKIYSTMAQAYLSASEEYGGSIDTWDLGSAIGNYNPDGNDKLAKSFAKYLDVNKFCGSELYNNCWRGVTYHLSGRYFETPNANRHSKMILKDGTLLAFYRDNCVTYTCGGFYVKLHNKNNNNILGRDVFYFKIRKEGILPFTIPIDGEFSTFCRKDNSRGCAGWVIYNENMDYLHCEGLSWNGAKRCKDLR